MWGWVYFWRWSRRGEHTVCLEGRRRTCGAVAPRLPQAAKLPPRNQSLSAVRSDDTPFGKLRYRVTRGYCYCATPSIGWIKSEWVRPRCGPRCVISLQIGGNISGISGLVGLYILEDLDNFIVIFFSNSWNTLTNFHCIHFRRFKLVICIGSFKLVLRIFSKMVRY